jgi:glycosyltransferase involved in cell wall biosynthesis
MPINSILVTTYHQAFLRKGGGEYELLAIALNLRKIGVLADVYGPYSRTLDAYDAVLHFSVHPGGQDLLRDAALAGKKIILWPNLWLKQSQFDGARNVVEEHLDLADVVIVKSKAEAEMLTRVSKRTDIPFIYMPTGVDPCFKEPAPLNFFSDTYQLEKFLLWIGIIEPNKNQLMVIKALSGLKMPVVFVGGFRYRDYFETCKKSAPEHFLFTGELPHKSDLLCSALQECSLFIEPSLEPPGKSSIEAAVSGAPMLLSDSRWSREHFGDDVTYVDPLCPVSIVDGVESALSKNKSNELARRIAAAHCFPDVLRPLKEYLDA